MKPPGDAPAVDETVDSELDTHLDGDVALVADAPRTRAGAEVRPATVRVPAQPNRAASAAADRFSPPPVQAAPRTADPSAADLPVADLPAADLPAVELEPTVAQRPAEPVLSERERQILAFERRWWRHAGAKEQAIRDTFGISATRYYQLLNGLLDNPAALAAEPVLVGRLRRLRSARARTRRR